MPADWFVHQNEKVHGPFDAATLKQFAASNKIGANTLVAQSADGPWHPASKVKGLFSGSPAPQAFAAPSPPMKVQAATPVAAIPTSSSPPAASVPASHQKGYAAQTLEPGEAIAFKTRLSDAVMPGPILILLLAGALFGLSFLATPDADGLSPDARSQRQFLKTCTTISGGVLAILGVSLFIDAMGQTQANEYVVTSRRVVIRTGFFKRKIEEFLLPSVDSVVVEQGLGGRVEKYGTLVLTVGGNRLRHKYVEDPFGFCRAVKEQRPRHSAWG